MALYWRIWAAVTLVNLAVLTIFVGLATLQFINISSRLVNERLAVLAERTASPFNAAARIGLPLANVRNANALLERARQTDHMIRAIHVYDAAQRIVHSTETPAPDVIPPAAAVARAASQGDRWHVESADAFLNILDITGRGGTTAGGILIVYPASGNLTQVRAMGAELALAAIAMLLVTAAISSVILRIGLDGPVRIFEAIDREIAGFERGAWRRAAASPATPSGDSGSGEFRQLLDAAEERYRAAGQAAAECGKQGQ